MLRYEFKWKRFFFWNKRTVVGHRWEKDQNKIVLFYEDGSLEEIKNWSKCIAKLGPDWAAAQKKAMELQAGTTIPTTF